MEKDQEISVILESIGLHKNEIFIFLDLIKSGKSGVNEISQRTGIHRSNTYDILQQLLKKGIVDLSVENEKKYFYPIDPEDLFDYLKQKQKDLEKIIPLLKEIQAKKEESQYQKD